MDPDLIQLIVLCILAVLTMVVTICIVVYEKKILQENIIFLVFSGMVTKERVTNEKGIKTEVLLFLGKIVKSKYEHRSRILCFITAMFLGFSLFSIFITHVIVQQEQGCPANIINKAEVWSCYYKGKSFDCFDYLVSIKRRPSFKVNKVVCTKIAFSPGLAGARAVGIYKVVLLSAAIIGAIYDKLGVLLYACGQCGKLKSRGPPQKCCDGKRKKNIKNKQISQRTESESMQLSETKQNAHSENEGMQLPETEKSYQITHCTECGKCENCGWVWKTIGKVLFGFVTFLFIALYLVGIGSYSMLLAKNDFTNLEIYDFIELLIASLSVFLLPYVMVVSTGKRFFLSESEGYHLERNLSPPPTV